MRNYLKNTFLFSIILILLSFLVILSNHIGFLKIPNNVTQNKNILVLGDSNTECAINDSIFASAVNKSASADSYFYSYLKLKHIVQNNPNIDTIVLGFAPHNIFDNGWLLDDSHINSHLKLYFPLMEFSDYSFFICNNPKAFLSTLPTITKHAYNNLFNRLLNNFTACYYGAYLKLERNKLQEVKALFKEGKPLPFFDLPNNFSISEPETLYLNKIISFCSSNHLKLYFINTPKRFELLKYQKYGTKEFYEFYNKTYSHIDFIDCSNLTLQDKNYGDFVHLNSNGANLFSSILHKEGLQKMFNTYSLKK